MAFTHLLEIRRPLPLSQLSRPQVRELQYALSTLGYPLGDVDGLVGPKTRAALAEFKADVVEGHPDTVGPQTVAMLEQMVSRIHVEGVDDFSTREGTIAAIVRQCRAQGLVLTPQIAYVLATAEWETNKTFQPVEEAYWVPKAEAWRKRNLRYYPYHGRGYVQLTWKNNYQKYADLLGVDMVNQPELACVPRHACFILVHGFRIGTFTGRRITDYIDETRCDYVNARRCINALDRAHDIARLAERHALALGD